MDDWGSLAESFPEPSEVWTAPSSMANKRCDLADILRHELLPRLVVRQAARRPPTTPRAATAADPGRLARDLVAGNWQDARNMISSRLGSGASLRSVMLEDIAAAARKLGEFWRDDDCDFLEVTHASAGLHALLRDISSEASADRRGRLPSLMLATAPGETHELGPDMAATMFRQAGWRVVRCGFEEGLAALADESFDAAGFSLSCDRYFEGLRRGIAEARRISRNPSLKVLAGGSLFAGRSDRAAKLGADALAHELDLAPKFPSFLQGTLRL